MHSPETGEIRKPLCIINDPTVGDAKVSFAEWPGNQFQEQNRETTLR